MSNETEDSPVLVRIPSQEFLADAAEEAPSSSSFLGQWSEAAAKGLTISHINYPVFVLSLF